MTPLSLFQKTLSQGEGALILSAVSRRYLSNFASSDGVLLVLPEEAFLFLDSRYYEMACLSRERREMLDGILPRPFPWESAIRELIASRALTRLYFEEENLTVRAFSRLKEKISFSEFYPLEGRLTRQRQVKSESELIRLRAAQALAEETFLYILPRLERGRTEREIAAEMEYFMKKNGAAAPSFETILVSGTRSSQPHGRAGEDKLAEGFVTMDFGCVLDGYCSDMTRTVCLGRADEEMKRVYHTVLEAQLAAIASVRAGVTGQAVDEAARSVIRRAGYGDAFGHSTGHGIGLEVHEAPSFSPYYHDPIAAGCVLSVEPGIYLAGRFGVRIEDLVVVREGDCENLNHTTKELLEL